MIKIAINGLGRIGRTALKIILDTPELELVAANDIVPIDNLAYLLKYDTAHGRYQKMISTGSGHLLIDGRKYRVFTEKDPSKLPWKELGVDIVFECTGHFTQREDLEKHVQAGARYVMLSAPAKSEDVTTVVHGVSHPHGDVQILACASCTTNCITPVIEVMGRRIGILKAIMTTVHAYTASQAIVDLPNKNYRRGRAAAANLVPTSTGAAIATTKALPQYKGLFDGVAVRAPIPVGSIADITLVTARKTTIEEVNQIFREEIVSDRYRDILSVAEDPIVSSDIVGDSHASIVDLGLTRVIDGDLVKIMSWYDNEWGFAHQMVREAVELGKR